jgi:hypothetical protein
MNSAARWLRNPAAILAPLAAIVFLLLLNLSEVDVYVGGTPEPPKDPPSTDIALPLNLSREAVCECACEHCHHLARVESAATVYKVVDADGWYRLFWAGDDTYYFDDVSYFLNALENRTWKEAAGRRVLHILYEKSCPEEEPRHACSTEIPVRVTLTYRLVLGGVPAVPAGRLTDPRGMIELPIAMPGEALRPYYGHFRGETVGALLALGWVLDTAPEVEYGPCSCGR